MNQQKIQRRKDNKDFYNYVDKTSNSTHCKIIKSELFQNMSINNLTTSSLEMDACNIKISKTIKFIISNELINQVLDSQDEKDQNTIALWGTKQSSSFEKSKSQTGLMSFRLNSI